LLTTSSRADNQSFPDSALCIHLKGRHSPRINSFQDAVTSISIDRNNLYTKLVTAHYSVIQDEKQNIFMLINDCSSDAIHFYKTQIEINKQESVNLCNSIVLPFLLDNKEKIICACTFMTSRSIN